MAVLRGLACLGMCHSAFVAFLVVSQFVWPGSVAGLRVAALAVIGAVLVLSVIGVISIPGAVLSGHVGFGLFHWLLYLSVRDFFGVCGEACFFLKQEHSFAVVAYIFMYSGVAVAVTALGAVLLRPQTSKGAK